MSSAINKASIDTEVVNLQTILTNINNDISTGGISLAPDEQELLYQQRGQVVQALKDLTGQDYSTPDASTQN